MITDPILALALSKVDVLDKEMRAGILAGRYRGTASVSLEWDLKVGESYEATIVAKADPWSLLALALSKLNAVTVDALVRECLAGPIDAKATKEAADAAIAAIKAPTKTLCSGKTSGAVTVNLIEAVRAVG